AGAILTRLRLLGVAVSFWLSFAAGIGVLALAGHTMVARWHLGPLSGFHFWWILVTSPEVLVFLFFMITDPKTSPRGARQRIVYGVAIGLLASVLIAPTTTEFAAKVALLSALTLVCISLPILRSVSVPLDRRLALIAVPAVIAAFAVGIVVSTPASANGFRATPTGALPPISILPSRGVDAQLDRSTAGVIAHDLLAATHEDRGNRLTLWLEPGKGQAPPIAVAQLAGRTYRLQSDGPRWFLQKHENLPQHLQKV